MTILRIHDYWGNKVTIRGFFRVDQTLIIPEREVKRIMKRLRGLSQTAYFKGITLDLCGPYDTEIRIPITSNPEMEVSQNDQN